MYISRCRVSLPEQQRGQSVKLLAFAFEGASPSRHIFCSSLERAWCYIGGWRGSTPQSIQKQRRWGAKTVEERKGKYDRSKSIRNPTSQTCNSTARVLPLHGKSWRFESSQVYSQSGSNSAW